MNDKETIEIELSEFLRKWSTDTKNIKRAFIELKTHIVSKPNLMISFKSRPGVSHSLRASIVDSDEKEEKLITLVDVIDDDPDNRWLSVCFYADNINNPDEEGDLIPGGLMGKDGYCFDLFENDETMVSYLKERIDEAIENNKHRSQT
jgi:hypothetical protein